MSIVVRRARRIARYLVAHGRKRIAVVNGPSDRTTPADREAGYRRGLVEVGRDMRSNLHARSDFVNAAFRQAAIDMMALPEPPDAMSRGNDPIAIGVLNGLRVCGCAGAASGAAALPLAAPALAQGKRTLRMATGRPRNFPGPDVASQRIADAIAAATDGRLTVQVCGAGARVAPFEAFDPVATGAADLSHAAEYCWQGKSAAFDLSAGVPPGMTTSERNAWVHHRGGQGLWDEVSAGFGIAAFMAGNPAA